MFPSSLPGDAALLGLHPSYAAGLSKRPPRGTYGGSSSHFVDRRNSAGRPDWAAFITDTPLPQATYSQQPVAAVPAAPQWVASQAPVSFYTPPACEVAATNLLRAIAIDFVRPIYLIESNLSNPPGLQCIDDTLAFTSRVLDVLAKPLLQQRSQWGGRGFAMVYGPDCCQTNHVLHEAAHFCDFVSQGPSDDLAHESAFEDPAWRASLERALNRVGPNDSTNSVSAGEGCATAEGFSDVERYGIELGSQVWKEYVAQPRDSLRVQNHGARWVRAHCHLGFRASQQGHLFDYEREVAGAFYQLSNGQEYAEALADEVMNRSSEPITAILRSPPPKAFHLLWYRDTGDTSELL